MPITVASVLSDSRALLNDTVVTYRYSDATLINFINVILNNILQLRPDLYNAFADVTCTTNEVLQSAPSDSHRLVDVLRIKNGAGLREVDRAGMIDGYATWTNTASGAALEWMRHPRNPNKFFVYPPSSAAQEIVVEYIKVPTVYTTSGDTISELPKSYQPTIVYGVVWLASSIDDEHVESGRAKMFMDSFLQGLGVTAQNKAVTDAENGGMPPKGA